ncbi:uncharacterized protein BDZ83DRAFT_752379 [Colletotrichum acutatum]|uniref:Uncharacterized protein n=1 Tax=Glomerella acutata TaxID=27357 RepID=A0AAD8UMS0_GLOAC|nr:uncharacterized protein BDZ83DRAFT_752379 [Colletotrichum acutatum]KAK1724805.1 hypothetical protein BDZ83DRAFT_752379 [Colletotrichum acutatum]
MTIYTCSIGMNTALGYTMIIVLPVEAPLQNRTEPDKITEVSKKHKVIMHLDGVLLGVSMSTEGCDATLEEIGRLMDIF